MLAPFTAQESTMAIDPNNPPVNSRVISTVRPSTADLAGNGGGLNVAWAENGVANSTLPGFYFGRVTDPQGTVAWTFVGGFGISTDSSNRLVIGDGTRIVRINGGEECVVTLVDPVANVVIGDGDASIVYTGAFDGLTYSVTLPVPAVKQKGRIIVVKEGSGTLFGASSTISVVVSGGSTIEGAASVDITTNWGMRSFLCTGTAWIRLGSS
jgi:hypothetical protein